VISSLLAAVFDINGFLLKVGVATLAANHSNE
jgi:hypothetical protein